MDDVMMPQEAADFLKLHLKTVYKLVRAKKIPVTKVGKQYRFSRARLEQWLGVPAEKKAVGE